MQLGGYSNTAPFTVGVKSKKNVPLSVGELNQSSFFDVFSVKYLHSKYQDRLCSVPYWLKWDADRKHLEIPIEALRKCWLSSGKPYVFQPVEIRSLEGNSHANAILIDVRNKTAERFEPHGSRARDMFPDFKYDSLDARLQTFFRTADVTYMSATEVCPYEGPQETEDDEKVGIDGYCAAWSLWFVDFRMAYPDVPVNDIVKNMVLKAREMSYKGSIREYLYRYLTQVYTYMFDEFPQYEDFFVNYDYYMDMKRQPAEFKRFLEHMNSLTKSPVDILYTDYNTKRRGRARSVTGKAMTIPRTKAGYVTLVPEVPDEFNEFFHNVLHVVMKN